MMIAVIGRLAFVMPRIAGVPEGVPDRSGKFMRLESVRKGMKAVAVFDNGLKNGDVSIYEVLKVGRVKVKVRDEHGNEGWLYPESIEREITEERYVDLLDEARPGWRNPPPVASAGPVP